MGNAFQSPLAAALYNAEATARGAPSIALSAGLSNRREMPATTPFLLEAVAQEVADRPAVLEALRNHQPRPLKDLPFVAVEGVSYLYDPARKRDHLAQDAKSIEAWLRPAPGTPIMRLAVKDSGYQLWEQESRPALDSAAGQLVLAAYRRDVVALRTLVNTLLIASEGSAPLADALSAAGLVVEPVPPPAPPEPKPAAPIVSVARPAGPPVVIAKPAPKERPQPVVVSAVVRPSIVREMTRPAPAPLFAPPVEPAAPTPSEASRAAARERVARAKRAASEAAAAKKPASEPPPSERPRSEPPHSEVSPRSRKPRKSAEPVDPAAVARDEALRDVRAWIRAALPLGRAVLARYGLWQRAETHFGSWDAAVEAAGIPLAPASLWELPARDRELSFDILVEALPNAVVARLCDVTVAKVARRRRDNGAPDPARQLHRRIVATNLLGEASDEVIAAQLGIDPEEVTKVREAEALDATA